MKISVERNDIVASLAIAQGIADKRSTVPILSHVLIEATDSAAVISATDQEIGVKQSCVADVATAGSIAINAAKLYAIAQACSDPITLEGSDARVEIASGKSRWKLNCLSAMDFPTMPKA